MLQTSVVKFDGKKGHAEQGRCGSMFSSCNVDGRCDISSGFVSKLISFESGTFNEVSVVEGAWVKEGSLKGACSDQFPT